jgi:DnaJ-class molecular chaperone
MPSDSDRPTRPDLSRPRCPKCHGDKRHARVVERGTAYSTPSSVCDLCHGKGWVSLDTYERWQHRGL